MKRQRSLQSLSRLAGLILIALLPLPAMAAGKNAPPNEIRLSLPPTPVAPVIDGIIAPAEWAGALKIDGFCHPGSPNLEPRQGSTWVAWDQTNLYIAVSSELPPNGKIITEVQQRDENTVHDDSIEIWLDPNRANKLAGRGDQRYYQMIFNSSGNLFDVAWDPTKGVPNSGWDLKGQTLKTRLNLEAKRWEVELALPWSALAVNPAELADREISLLLARNFKYPWVQAPWLPAAGFSDWKRAPVISLRADAPIMQEQGFGAVFDTSLDYRLDLRNPAAAAKTYQVAAAVIPGDMPEKKKSETLTVPAGGTATYNFKLDQGYLHTESPFDFVLTVTSADGSNLIVSRSFTVQPRREKIWELPDQTDDSTAFFIAYHPSTRRLAVKLDLTSFKDGEKATGAAVTVLDPAGKTVAKEELVLDQRLGEKSLTLPAQPDGTYVVRAVLKGIGAPDKPFEKSFVIRHFPWAVSTLGIADRVFPPFTPVTVKERQVSVVLRTYRMNGFGLWDSIIAKDREILAAPMAMEFTTAAGPGRWQELKCQMTANKENAAEFASAATAAELVLAARSRIEEDGCMKVILELTPGKILTPIDSLTVSIPLKDELMPLWHNAVSGAIRSNPTGYAPAGQGLVWDSTQTGNGAMIGNIIPYLWLGGEKRGLAWFCDNDKGWAVDDAKPQMTLTREKGRLTLRLHLFTKPVTLAQPRTIVFGLQASPVKPMPADFRTRTDVPMHGGSNGYWGITPTFSGKYPAQNDYSFVDEMAAARISGQPNPEFMKRWVAEKIAGVSQDKTWIKDRTNHVNAGFHGMMLGRGMKPVMLYFEEHVQDQTTPEWVAYQDEWGIKPFTSRVWETKPERSWGAFCGFSTTYQNFALWHALQWYTRGIGIYCDNVFPRNNYNPAFSAAYCREDGQLQASSEMWNLRDYHKRMWILEKQCQPLTPWPLLISLHMTNGNLLPIIGWADVSLDNEWGWNSGSEPFPPEVLRTEMTGLQAGNYPHALFPVFGNLNTTHSLSKDEVARIEWGMRFTHEILRQTENPLDTVVRTFGYGRDDCRVIRYWDPAKEIPRHLKWLINNPQVKWLALYKPAEKTYLAVLVNWSKDPQAAGLNSTNIGQPKFSTCVDAESGVAVNPAVVDLPGWTVKLLKFTP